MKSDIKERWVTFVQWFSRAGLLQDQLATRAGVSQSAVSRILEKCPQKDGQAFKRLCKYASENAGTPASGGAAPRPIDDQSITEAIWEVWNGTPEHARAIAALIRAVGVVARVGGDT